MKSFFTLLLLTAACSLHAQTTQVASLPAGKYEAVLESNKTKWERGDIILIDQNTYKLSSNSEVGEYKFSVAAQRIFFTSGSLKNYYAKTIAAAKGPAILIPVSENQESDLKVTATVSAYFKP